MIHRVQRGTQSMLFPSVTPPKEKVRCTKKIIRIIALIPIVGPPMGTLWVVRLQSDNAGEFINEASFEGCQARG
eukprot:12914343-Prorocentrum_lima.AAC.1